MSTFSDFHEEALAEVISLLGSPLTYNGATYRGIVSAIGLSEDFRDGGLLQNIDTEIILQKSDFGTVPVAGQKVVIDGRSVRIVKVDVDESSYRLQCETAKI